MKITWDYDQFGRLAKITKGNDVVEYSYNDRGRVSKRIANRMETYYTYTPLGQLETKSLGAAYGNSPIASLKYFYANDGSIAAREVNGVKQSYQYDQLGQLTAVVNAAGAKVEQYTYDPVGNILKKEVDGKVTTYTYDESNQLVSSTTDGKVTNYEYDAAGRMVKEGAKTYAYNWLNKVMNITENGKLTNSYSYSVDGQLASANEHGKQENFIWDGLALIKRGTTEYVYEPAVTGGNPILADGKGLFNDMLGNSLGVAEKDKFTAIKRDAFGKTLENPAGNDYNLFTGKPQIGGLGYAFLFRNYRPNLGKWQTQDPLGYPDGWNNLAYVNNLVIGCIDRFGTDIYNLVASRAVGDLGHAAAIIGNDSTGYKIVDFGGYSGTNELAATYSTLSAATAVLQNGRPAGEKFDFVQVWNTSSVQDNTAYTVTQGYIANGYDSTQNNCSQVIAKGVIAAGETASLNSIPNLAFTQNTGATTIPISSIE